MRQVSEPSWQPCSAVDWRRLQIKRAFSVTLGKMLQSSPACTSDAEVPYLKAQHVQWDGITLADLPKMWASETEINALLVEQGDLLVCEGGEVGRSAIVGESPQDRTIIQNALHLVRGRNGANPRFLYYLLRHAFDQGWFAVICSKSTIAHFTVSKFEDMWTWLPDNSLQRAIADYLDRETGGWMHWWLRRRGCLGCLPIGAEHSSPAPSAGDSIPMFPSGARASLGWAKSRRIWEHLENRTPRRGRKRVYAQPQQCCVLE